MRNRRLAFVATATMAALSLTLPQSAQSEPQAKYDQGPRGKHEPALEPDAGSWRTWVISSGEAYRVPRPPSPAATRAELRSMRELIRRNDDQARQQIKYWDAGAPAYRWIDLINGRLMAGTPTTAFSQRVYLYVAQAMYDATIATWESKYYYNRARPSELDHKLPTALEVPNSPSYPSEHAAAAQAAATVLAHFLPAEAASFQAMAEEAGWSRVRAGLQYPSDYNAGLALGRSVGQAVIDQANSDGSSAVWTGSVPVGPCYWTGGTPGNVTVGTWNPILLTSQSQFRPAPPPPCDSPQVLAETEAVRTFPRTFTTNYKAYYWQSPDGIAIWGYRYADKFMFEDGTDRNPPRAARAYALLAGLFFDAFIASNDGKFAYWYLRPHQLDSRIVPLFPVPPFPSYPSNHSTVSTARGELLAYLFPDRASFVRALGKEAGDSRIWAGIHYEMDNASGVQLGKDVAQVFVNWAQSDGSQ